jgi:hypothetical protein
MLPANKSVIAGAGFTGFFRGLCAPDGRDDRLPGQGVEPLAASGERRDHVFQQKGGAA